METPIHAADEVDKNETVPKIVAAIAGIVILAILGIVVAYSGLWSPPPTTDNAKVTVSEGAG